MNKLLTVIIFLAMTGLVSAKDIIDNNASNKMIKETKVVNEPNIIYPFKNNKNTTTQGRGDFLIRVGNNNLQHQFPATTPVAYDPSSGLLSIAMTTFHFEGPSNGFSGTTLYHLRTTDNGITWDSSFVYRDNGTSNVYAPMRPSIAFTNPTKSSNIEDVNYVTYGQAIYKSNDGVNFTNTDQGKGLFAFYSPDFGGIVPQKADGPILGGNLNNPQSWGELILSGDDELNLVVGSGTLRPDSEASQYGYYGYFNFDFNTSEETSNNPEEWWYKNFRQSESKQSSFNPPVRIGNDKEGNLYNVADHFYIDDDQSRYVSFSKSTDNGQNWSTYERMPRIVYTDFVSSLTGGNYTDWVVGGSTAYQPSELFIRGVDDFSFFTRLYIFNSNDDEVPARFFIMDMRYNKGTWSINPVQELESFGATTFSQHSSTINNADKVDLVINPAINNSYGNLLKMSRTADGKNLVLYWIDIVPDKYRAFPPFNVYQDITDPLSGTTSEQLAPIDTLAVTDIFAKVYDIENDTWGDSMNITGDDDLEYLYNVPQIIKSTEEAIILTYESDKTVNSPLTAPEAMVEVFTGRIPNLLVDVFNVNEPLNSVENELSFNVELGDAFPNPAVNTNLVSISFELEEPSMISISMFDQMGNKVANVYNQFASKGFQALNADISNLSSGTYYYQLDVQGHTFTKKLVVVK